jgi:hypothetical protein
MKSTTVPVLLGVLGLIPFVAGAFVAAALPVGYVPVASYAVLAYGLVILSFLGGVHWGRALATGDARTFIWSVVPSLLAFAAAGFNRPLALAFLSAAFVVVGAYDVVTFRREGPRWYASLRVWLTLVVAVSLAVVAFRAEGLRVEPFGSIAPPG